MSWTKIKIETAPPEGQSLKKNKKGLASVILATNSPNSELVVPILTETVRFVNKKMKKNEKTTNYQKTLEKRC